MVAKALLADAERTLALVQVEDIGQATGIAPDAIVKAYQNYIDLQRRRRSATMTNGDLIAFERTLDRLRACLRFFGESV
jgi:hypothetical protein